MCLDGVALTVEAEDTALPTRRLAQPKKKADGGRLARTVWAEVADHFTLCHLEIEIVERNRIAVTLGQTLGTYGHFCHCHSPPLSFVNQRL